MFRKCAFRRRSLLALAGQRRSAADIKEFRVGILGGENEADRLRNYQCLADHLKAEFGFEKVSLFPAADYDGVIQGLLGGTLDYRRTRRFGLCQDLSARTRRPSTPILTTAADRRLHRLLLDLARPQDFRHHDIKSAQGQEARLSPIRIRPRAT